MKVTLVNTGRNTEGGFDIKGRPFSIRPGGKIEVDLPERYIEKIAARDGTMRIKDGSDPEQQPQPEQQPNKPKTDADDTGGKEEDAGAGEPEGDEQEGAGTETFTEKQQAERLLARAGSLSSRKFHTEAAKVLGEKALEMSKPDIVAELKKIAEAE